MKPDWKDAPSFANWLVGDTEGFAWAENDPEFFDGMWQDDETGQFISFGEHDPSREKFKEARP